MYPSAPLTECLSISSLFTTEAEWSKLTRFATVGPMQTPNTGFHIRANDRLATHCLVYFSTGAVCGTGTVWNLSLSGFRVDSDIALQQGTSVTIFAFLPDNQHAIVVNQAMVCWSRGHEFGLAIQNIQPRDATQLQRFIRASLSLRF